MPASKSLWIAVFAIPAAVVLTGCKPQPDEISALTCGRSYPDASRAHDQACTAKVRACADGDQTSCQAMRLTSDQARTGFTLMTPPMLPGPEVFKSPLAQSVANTPSGLTPIRRPAPPASLDAGETLEPHPLDGPQARTAAFLGIIANGYGCRAVTAYTFLAKWPDGGRSYVAQCDGKARYLLTEDTQGTVKVSPAPDAAGQR